MSRGGLYVDGRAFQLALGKHVDKAGQIGGRADVRQHRGSRRRSDRFGMSARHQRIDKTRRNPKSPAFFAFLRVASRIIDEWATDAYSRYSPTAIITTMIVIATTNGGGIGRRRGAGWGRPSRSRR